MWVIMLFFLGSLVIGGFSWRVFSNPRSYGFYRFLALEGIWAVMTMNVPWWFRDDLSARQIASWILIFGFLGLAISALYLLGTVRGLSAEESSMSHASKRASRLLTTGPYRFIRHPLYTSLVLLAWGSALKGESWVSYFFSIAITGILYVTALAEEEENIDRFGEAYVKYMARTHMFVPWVF